MERTKQKRKTDTPASCITTPATERGSGKKNKKNNPAKDRPGSVARDRHGSGSISRHDFRRHVGKAERPRSVVAMDAAPHAIPPLGWIAILDKDRRKRNAVTNAR